MHRAMEWNVWPGGLACSVTQLDPILLLSVALHREWACIAVVNQMQVIGFQRP